MDAATEIDLDRLKGMSILLAEDNVTNQLVATQMLETLGAEVDIAADGAIALERLRERTYDVLLIDIEMPRVSGLDVIRAIRADEGPLSDALVIALTAYAMQEHREKITGVGADGLIAKPITSIKQFGVDILSLLDGRAEKTSAGAAPAPGAVIERMIYESLAASIGDDAMPELLVRIESDLQTARTDISEAGANADLDLMARASHILISVAGTVGAARLQRQSERLNRLAEEQDADAAATLAEDALPELDNVIAFIASERKARTV
ncbi:response regulator [Pikeienuella piscinae]|uniref:Response regulator n=1 Tax=Pikeienuella piscinae TaxID=2748098 RepID=A0A7L5BTL8_9RHOB|nr:response regulator [Pikeienuella piscinae]QIE54812.1 response regulator [Pikeienuella piscinae]